MFKPHKSPYTQPSDRLDFKNLLDKVAVTKNLVDMYIYELYSLITPQLSLPERFQILLMRIFRLIFCFDQYKI